MYVLGKNSFHWQTERVVNWADGGMGFTLYGADKHMIFDRPIKQTDYENDDIHVTEEITEIVFHGNSNGYHGSFVVRDGAGKTRKFRCTNCLSGSPTMDLKNVYIDTDMNGDLNLADTANCQKSCRFVADGKRVRTDSGTFKARLTYTPTVKTAIQTDNKLTLTGTRFDELLISVGKSENKECTNPNYITSNKIECDLPSLPAGTYPLSFTAKYGAVASVEEFNIVSKLTVSKLSPDSGGLGGGTLLMITGTGFSKDTVVSMYTADGDTLCKFCYIDSMPSGNELLVLTPPSATPKAVIVLVSHEYLSDRFQLTFTYKDVTPTYDATFHSTDPLGGGEMVTLSGDLGDCSDVKLDIGYITDPCAVGAHYCSEYAVCNPTADGLDYTCTCPESAITDSFWDGKHGNGFDCGRLALPDLVEETEAETECQRKWKNGWRLFQVNSKYDEEVLRQAIYRSYKASTEGTYFSWYGETKCGRITRTCPIDATGDPDCSTLGEHEGYHIEFPDGNCDSWGSSRHGNKKRPMCQRYSYQNCYEDSTNDYGRQTYRGLKTTTITGRKCIDWKDTKYYQDHHAFMDRRVIPNGCQSNWNSDDGVHCPTFLLPDGGSYLESCGIPRCSDLQKQLHRRQCTIRSVAPLLEAGLYRDSTYNDIFDIKTNHCYIGHTHHDRILNPRRCYYRNRYPYSLGLIPVDVENNHFKIVRNWKNDDYVLVADFTYGNEDDHLKFIRTDLTGGTIFAVDPVGDQQGVFTIRTGQKFLVAPRATSSSYIRAVHEHQLDSYDLLERHWKIECTSDDYGDLIHRVKPPFNRLVSVPTCPTDLASPHQYDIRLPSIKAGSYSGVIRSNEYGRAQGVIQLKYGLIIESIEPKKVGSGGGSLLTIKGWGFSDETKATLCETDLVFHSFVQGTGPSWESTLIYETVPLTANNNCLGNPLTLFETDAATGNTIESQNSANMNNRKRRQASSTSIIDNSLTPGVTSITPKLGGTAGGTYITIRGSKFGTDPAAVSVTIFGVPCVVDTVEDSKITCTTGIFNRVECHPVPHCEPTLHCVTPDQCVPVETCVWTQQCTAVEQVPVEPVVTISGGPGRALYENLETFWYIDRWSSSYTWGCPDDSCLPKQGEIIVIPRGQVILLDITTPILAVLLLDGGRLIWDRKDGIELHMQYGIVNSGGSFEIGTEEEPFCPHKALIMLYGHQRSINLPIYGAKVLAVRFGTFDIHGCRKTTTWTELSETAEAGTSEIYLTHAVYDDWLLDDEIIIAATGDLTNFHRSEKRKVKSADSTKTDGKGWKVELDKPLEHRHISVCSNGPDNNGLGWAWTGEICTRAEVGLLTRNIKMMGNIDQQWEQDLPACKLGIGTAFGVQTCFQNRFGHETGSDQFGSVLFLHKPTHAKIEFLEVTHAGQARV